MGPGRPCGDRHARDMVCSPCSLAQAADCRRGLACLRELEPARVYEACKRLLLPNGVSPPPEPDRGIRPRSAARKPVEPVRP